MVTKICFLLWGYVIPINTNPKKQLASGGSRETRNATRPLNVMARHGRLELRSNFFSVRVTESWNSIPDKIKSMRTSNGFKEAYKTHRE